MATDKFSDAIKDINKEKGCLPEQVFIADTSVLFWNKMQERKFISKEKKWA